MTSTTMNLYDANKNDPLAVVSVPDIELLRGLGVRVGTPVAVQGRHAFGGPVLLRIDGTYTVALGKSIATQITVQGQATQEQTAQEQKA